MALLHAQRQMRRLLLVGCLLLLHCNCGPIMLDVSNTAYRWHKPWWGELQIALYTIDSLPTKEDDEAPNNINVC